MNLSSLITGAGAVALVGYNVYDFKKKKIRKDKVQGVGATLVSTTTTAMLGGTFNHFTMQQIHEKYASAYVESMSDEELERALIQMDLLAESFPEEDVKRI